MAWSKTDTPVTSDGSRSGVNWIRFQVRATDAAIARASDVLPTPGTSSIRRWPSASTQLIAALTTWSLPCITRLTLATRRSKRWTKPAISGLATAPVIVAVPPRCGVETRSSAAWFPTSPSSTMPQTGRWG